MKKFEYNQYSEFLPTQNLNELGMNGWELVSFGVSQSNRLIYIFKREIVEHDEDLTVSGGLKEN